jgi:exodeoxyribonuclease VII large subunit
MLTTIGAEKRNIENFTQNTSVIKKRLELALAQYIKNKRDYFHQLCHLQETLSHQAALARGYALVTNNSGKLVRSVTQTQKAETLLIDLSDGQLTTQIIETSQVKNIKETPAPKKASKNKSDNKQGQLF